MLLIKSISVVPVLCSYFMEHFLDYAYLLIRMKQKFTSAPGSWRDWRLHEQVFTLLNIQSFFLRPAVVSPKKNCIHEDNDKLELKLMSSVTGFVFPPCFTNTFFSFCISKHIILTFPFCKETVLKSGGGNAASQSNYKVIESCKLEKMFKIVSLTINLTCWVP